MMCVFMVSYGGRGLGAAFSKKLLNKAWILSSGIRDKVVTGFGLIGRMFGGETCNLRPDFMAITKGLNSAYAPLSGSIILEWVFDVLSQGVEEHGPLCHGRTYLVHPVCATAGLTTLHLIDDVSLVENAETPVPSFLSARGMPLEVMLRLLKSAGSG
jgi:adenosylmethionine-8-amino-7-oxononanoate aminotransferase